MKWTRTAKGWESNGWTAFEDFADNTHRRTWILIDPSGKRRKFGRLKDAKRFARCREEETTSS